MSTPQFTEFRLVGGTALSLYRGHRKSVDIDLFSDATYGSIDFNKIDSFLKNKYSYVDSIDYGVIGMGKSYYVGEGANECIKLDLYYTDPFICEFELIDKIRIATIEEIIAMKMDVILRTGRKKDFWDIHELIKDYSFDSMLDMHLKRYPYNHNRKLLKENFLKFSSADFDFEPICLRGKHWEIIKLDLWDFAN